MRKIHKSLGRKVMNHGTVSLNPVCITEILESHKLKTKTLLPAHILSVLSNFSYAYMTERGK
jgi:hypothetical protein